MSKMSVGNKQSFHCFRPFVIYHLHSKKDMSIDQPKLPLLIILIW